MDDTGTSGHPLHVAVAENTWRFPRSACSTFPFGTQVMVQFHDEDAVENPSHSRLDCRSKIVIIETDQKGRCRQTRIHGGDGHQPSMVGCAWLVILIGRIDMEEHS